MVIRSRRYPADDRPIEVAVSFLRLSIAEGTVIVETNTGPGGICARLEDAGHVLDHFVEEVTAAVRRNPACTRHAGRARAFGSDRDRCMIFNAVILYEGVELGVDCVVEDRVRLGYDSTVGPVPAVLRCLHL